VGFAGQQLAAAAQGAGTPGCRHGGTAARTRTWSAPPG